MMVHTINSGANFHKNTTQILTRLKPSAIANKKSKSDLSITKMETKQIIKAVLVANNRWDCLWKEDFLTSIFMDCLN